MQSLEQVAPLGKFGGVNMPIIPIQGKDKKLIYMLLSAVFLNRGDLFHEI